MDQAVPNHTLLGFTPERKYTLPPAACLPPEVYGAADNQLGRKVARSFESEMDPDVLRYRALAHIRTAIEHLPDHLKVTSSEVPVPEDFGWLIAVLMRSFSPQRLLSFTIQELVDLVQQMMRRLDLNEVGSEMVMGPQMLAMAGAMLSAPRMVMSPLERTLMTSVVRSLAYLAPAAVSLFQQDTQVPSGEIPYSWRVSLARSVRFLKSKQVTVDRAWANARKRVLAADAAAAQLPSKAPIQALNPAPEPEGFEPHQK